MGLYASYNERWDALRIFSASKPIQRPEVRPIIDDPNICDSSVGDTLSSNATPITARRLY